MKFVITFYSPVSSMNNATYVKTFPCRAVAQEWVDLMFALDKLESSEWNMYGIEEIEEEV